VKRWFLVLMMLVLPLRGLVGDAMAGEMLAMHMAGAAAASQVTAQAAPAAHHECMDHAGSASMGGEAPASEPVQAGADCPTCASCQACSAVALTLPPAPALPVAAPRAPPASSDTRFASTVPAQGLKPPIS
jgi:hypothetical protein